MKTYCGKCLFSKHRWIWKREWEQEVVDVYCNKLNKYVYEDLDWYNCSATCKTINPEKTFCDVQPDECPLLNREEK